MYPFRNHPRRFGRYKPGREISGPVLGLLRITILPMPLVEIQGVTQGVVLEFPLPSPSSLPKPTYEGLPSGPRHDLRPLPRLHHSRPSVPPPPIFDLDRPYSLPPFGSRSDCRSGAIRQSEARKAEATYPICKDEIGRRVVV